MGDENRGSVPLSGVHETSQPGTVPPPGMTSYPRPPSLDRTGFRPRVRAVGSQSHPPNSSDSPPPLPPLPGEPPFYNYVPFLSELPYPATFDGRRTWREIKGACLHRFASQGRIVWERYLGHGFNGVVYKARIGDGGPFAVKIFWHTRPPRPSFAHWKPLQWSFATECHNIATLDILKQTLENSPSEVTLWPEPHTLDHAVRNMFCFSEEAEVKGPRPEPEEAVPCPPFPPMTRCHGWMRIEAADLPNSFHLFRNRQNPRDYEDLGYQYAIVYQYVQPTREHDLVVAQAQIDFFYMTGFRMCQPRTANWNQGMLVDFGDLLRPVDGFWRGLMRTRRMDAATFFALDPTPQPESDSGDEAGRVKLLHTREVIPRRKPDKDVLARVRGDAGAGAGAGGGVEEKTESGVSSNRGSRTDELDQVRSGSGVGSDEEKKTESEASCDHSPPSKDVLACVRGDDGGGGRRKKKTEREASQDRSSNADKLAWVRGNGGRLRNLAPRAS